MQAYKDVTGEVCQAFQLSGPTVINTTEGERCGEAGQWVVYIAANQGCPVLLTDAEFAPAFTLAE